MELREFLYLDRTMVRDFLAQIEGGVVDEATEREARSGKGGIGAGFGVGPASLKGEKSKETSSEIEAVVRQSAASEFDRLYTHLNDDSLLVLDEVSEAGTVNGLRRKQFLEVDARVQMSGVTQLLTLFSSFASIAPLMEQFGTSVEPETMSGIQAMSNLMGTSTTTPVIATISGDCRVRVALELRNEFITTDEWNLDASALIKVQRLVKDGERYMVGDPFGGLMTVVPAADRNKLLESLQSPELAAFGLGEAEITAPAIIATPIAIYR